MSDDDVHQLSEQERQLEDSLHQQMMNEEEEQQQQYDDAAEDGQQQQYHENDEQQHEYYDDEQGVHGEYIDDSNIDPNSSTTIDPLSASLLALNIDSHDTINSDSSSNGNYPVFRLGEGIARARGVMSAVKCDRTNGHVYMTNYSGEIILFDFNAHKEVWRRRIDLPSTGRPLQITCIDIRGTKLALGGTQGETVIYDLETFQVTQIWMDHKQRVSAIAWVGDSNSNSALVYTTSHDGYFLVRDSDRRGKIVHSFITCTCPLSAMQVESPNIVYIGSWDGQVKKLDLEKKQVILVLKSNLTKESPIRCFALAPSPQVKKKKKGASTTEELPVYILIIAHGIGEIKSWDMRSGKIHVEAYQGCNDVVNSMTVWNGKLYAASDDKYVRMFDINSGVCIESLSGHENGVTCVEVCGVTPVITPEMIEAAAQAAATARSTSRKARAASAAGGINSTTQQGVGNELLISTGFDGQSRSYKLAAIEAALQLKFLKLEEQKQLSFENFLALKNKKR